ncbi:MAG TPA: uroporphyrinogen-III synthase [Acetobacteraceae bacterium]|nr:uroporphyrinogen-III synthase [Acetobacteraceae bacterium]
MPDRPGVLVTRPEPGASATAAKLAARGFTPILAPLLRIRARPTRLPEPARLQAVLVTSANALPGLPTSYHRVPLHAVGDATAAKARALGFAKVTSAAGDALALASLVRGICRPDDGALLLASGAGQGGPLAASLREAGFSVLRRTLYSANPVAGLPRAARLALMEGRVGTILFFSTETAQTFAHLIVDAGLAASLASITALAIAERAAEVLRRLPFRAVRVALSPNEEALIALLP